MNPNEDKRAMQAANEYLLKHGLSLPDNVTYEYIIDGIYICVNDTPVLVIGLPPVSDYPVRGTEYTNQYLHRKETIAV